MHTFSFIIGDDTEIDFTKYENVLLAFTKLMTVLQDSIPECRLENIKNRCIAVTDGKFRECIKTQANNINNFFILLSVNKLFCNWINIRLVEIIAIASGSERLNNLVEKYKEAIYPRKLQQVWKYIPQQRNKAKYYDEVTAIFDSKSLDNVTVEELVTHSEKLANNIALLLMVVKPNCLSITWLVPTDKVYQLLLSMLTVPQELREEDFLQIGTWVVHHPQSVLKMLKKEFG